MHIKSYNFPVIFRYYCTTTSFFLAKPSYEPRLQFVIEMCQYHQLNCNVLSGKLSSTEQYILSLRCSPLTAFFFSRLLTSPEVAASDSSG